MPNAMYTFFPHCIYVVQALAGMQLLLQKKYYTQIIFFSLAHLKEH